MIRAAGGGPPERLPPTAGGARLGSSRTADRSQSLLAEIQREFPDFRIVPKRDSAVQRAIAIALRIVTVGGQRHYLTRYHTVLFGRLYVPDAWDAMSDDARYVLLRHERVHLRQSRRMGQVTMAFVYLFPWLPLVLSWGRARLEWEAYVETIRATAEIHGIDAARDLEIEIVRRYVGPDYGWMWPFPKSIRRWFHHVIAELETELETESACVDRDRKRRS